MFQDNLGGKNHYMNKLSSKKKPLVYLARSIACLEEKKRKKKGGGGGVREYYGGRNHAL